MLSLNHPLYPDREISETKVHGFATGMPPENHVAWESGWDLTTSELDLGERIAGAWCGHAVLRLNSESVPQMTELREN